METNKKKGIVGDAMDLAKQETRSPKAVRDGLVKPMEKNKTADTFCKIYTEFHGDVINNVSQIVHHTFTGKELMEFCDFYSTQQSKEKDEELRVTELLLSERQRVLDAIPNCESHGANCVPHAIEWINQKILQDEEIKRLREEVESWKDAAEGYRNNMNENLK